jgi:5,10-methylene-tetrahydrofolate dehydrogenase/methenyl tetrahydrofolate cyclohydrolase
MFTRDTFVIMENNIQDKVVVITSASSGIGKATALLLSERGAKVDAGHIIIFLFE